MSANGISTLATKELRQIAKLELAATKRATDGNARPYYDLTQLPTLYDDNSVVDNENAGGLVLGRPWISTPPGPTYAFGVIPTTIDEGVAGTFNVTTTNVDDGTTLYWTIETNAGDFATASGSFTVTSNAGSFTVTPTADVTTEGTDAFTVAIRTVSTSGDIVATSGSVDINDTSLTPDYITSNLVLHLDAANASSYPGSGTTWTDLSGNSRNATLTDVTYTSDDSGALVFNGSTSIGIINDTVINRYTNNFSVEVWYTSNNNTPRVLRTGASSSGFNLGSYTTSPTKWKVTKYGVIDLFVGDIPQNTAWHQVVLVYSSTGGTKVYVDGALSQTNASTNPVRATTWTYLEVGRSESGSHNGKLGIVRYYNAVLSDADVLQNFNANKARYGL